MSTPALTVKDLTVDLDNHRVIDHVSFAVAPGETTAIIGPNGAGKSVLIKAILRLIPKKSGEVTIFDIPHERYRQLAPLLSYIPQTLNLDRTSPLTIKELFALKSKRLFGLTRAEQSRMQSLLDLVGMRHYQHAALRTLSGGQMQRVLLAYSLMDKPRLLILDEPAAGIDVQGQETVYTLLQRIQKTEQLTLLLISHELEVVMRYATQVLCLNKKLLCAGVPRQVLSNDLLEEMYGSPISHFAHASHHHPAYD